MTGDGAEVRLDGEHGILGAVRRHPLGTFYLLAFLISWGYWVPNAVSGGDLTHAPGLMGPMIAALVITGLTGGRAGLRDLAARMTRWRVPVRWYVAAVAPLAVAVGVTATLVVAGAEFPGWAAFARMPDLPDVGVLGVVALTLLVNGYGEETGWRGFALPRFRRWHAKLQASILIAIPWVVWHLPTFFIDSGFRGSLNPLSFRGGSSASSPAPSC